MRTQYEHRNEPLHWRATKFDDHGGGGVVIVMVSIGALMRFLERLRCHRVSLTYQSKNQMSHLHSTALVLHQNRTRFDSLVY